MVAGVMNLACTLSLAILMMKRNNYEIPEHPHARMGIAIIASIIFVCLTGIIMRLRIFKRLSIYWIHKIFGYCVLVVA